MFSRDVAFRWWGHVWTTNVIHFSQTNPTAILEKSSSFRWTAKALFQRERWWSAEFSKRISAVPKDLDGSIDLLNEEWWKIYTTWKVDG